ncbi:YkuS family protein [Clostridiaceae bacterium 35-E11]
MKKDTIAVQNGLDDIAKTLKKEGYQVVGMEKIMKDASVVVYSGVDTHWAEIGDITMIDYNEDHKKAYDDIFMVNAANKTLQEVVDIIQDKIKRRV